MFFWFFLKLLFDLNSVLWTLVPELNLLKLIPAYFDLYLDPPLDLPTMSIFLKVDSSSFSSYLTLTLYFLSSAVLMVDEYISSSFYYFV